MPNDIGRSHTRGHRLLPVAALFVMVTAGLAPHVAAQVVRPPGGGIGGGAGLKPMPPPLPPMAPTLTPPALPTPVLPTPVVPPPVAAPQPATPAAPAVVRFRCQLDPGAEACKEPPAADGGGGDEECNCARDYCYDDPTGFRVCQKQ